MDSFWLNNFEKPSYSSLNKDIEVDICIIGGGITGISCGYYLSKAGLKICILEKDKIMERTSGHTTAKITAQHGLIYKYLFDSYGKDYAQKYLNSNLEAITNIKKIIDLERINCDFEFQNSYIYTNDLNSVKKLNDEVHTLKDLNYSARLLDEIDLPVPNVKAAIEFKEQAQFNPIKYVSSLCKSIKNNSGIIFENSKVIKMNKFKKIYNLTCNKHTVSAKYVIISTRYPIINFPGFHFLKMYSETSNLIALETNSPLFNGMYINSDIPTLSFRTSLYNGKRILLVGGFNHKTGAKIDLSNNYTFLEQQALKLYPDSKVISKWNTHDSVSLDKIPYIGDFSNLYPNVYVATGFKKWGMTTSNIAANIISDKILKRDNIYADIYNSKRFKPFKNRKELKNIIKESSYNLVFNKFNLPKSDKIDISNDEGKIINYNGTKIGMYKDKFGKEYKIIPVCSHLGCELSWNNLDNTWDCPCHGSRYNYDGTLIYGPSCKNLKTID